ncbi:acetyl/propionyl/methylcrotonyl-CoA carboxylase subunit alpha [Microbulbifer sp. 2201CG32-9]|uniref:acetyl/propionyl/methylcrotonyl-CoA carboxylase subunit alpha n=1 Tax=Microbulbifer sp. 2201CG32-9 TaxID=3232309 RepID=UPI00345C5E6F
MIHTAADEPTSPTLLIANRGEIALRIMRTARAEGYRVAAIFSDADRDAPHVRKADMAVAIGGNTPQESYLCIDKVITAAEKVGASLVHPGYGFLSENADFARACADRGLVFVGPSAEVIELMGNKRRAKNFAATAGVPCIPGFVADSDDAALSDTEVEKAVTAIGLPLMIKAADGGGGRGMRLVRDRESLWEQLRSARSEALSAFGSDEVIVEKAVVSARHIEIQIFADSQGNVIHLGERDCSVQRRHQKIIEESPSPAVDHQLRERMGAAAVRLAHACAYVGAGTVEFLLDAKGDFFFLEMNTRLQVEHPVTEMVTGLDLVAWQLAIARGKPLPIRQEGVTFNGHAIEARLYAEDPYNGFLPQTGTVYRWSEPEGPGLRCDHGISAGDKVTPFYDPMLGKLIAFGRDRDQARRRLLVSLQQLEYLGPTTNGPYLIQLLADSGFIAGHAATDFIEAVADTLKQPQMPALLPPVAAVVFHQRRLQPQDVRSGRANWRSGGDPASTLYQLQRGAEQLPIFLSCSEDGYRVESRNEAFVIRPLDLRANDWQLEIDAVRYRFSGHLENDQLTIAWEGVQWNFLDRTLSAATSTGGPDSDSLTAPMDGMIVEVRVQANQPVKRGEIIAVMETMKMEHPLTAGCDGAISQLQVRAGEQVRGGQLLARIKPEAATTDSAH